MGADHTFPASTVSTHVPKSLFIHTGCGGGGWEGWDVQSPEVQGQKDITNSQASGQAKPLSSFMTPRLVLRTWGGFPGMAGQEDIVVFRPQACTSSCSPEVSPAVSPEVSPEASGSCFLFPAQVICKDWSNLAGKNYIILNMTENVDCVSAELATWKGQRGRGRCHSGAVRGRPSPELSQLLLLRENQKEVFPT